MDNDMGRHDEAFRAFFEAEFAGLRRFAYLLTGDWTAGEDLAQDAMVRTYNAWDRIRERERPAVYARAVVLNRHRSILRRTLVERRFLAAHRSEEPPPQMSEDALFLWSALRSLPPRQMAALVLRFYEDLPEAEVALILDAPVGTVKSLVHRGLARLRAQLGTPEVGPMVAGGSGAR